MFIIKVIVIIIIIVRIIIVVPARPSAGVEVEREDRSYFVVQCNL